MGENSLKGWQWLRSIRRPAAVAALVLGSLAAPHPPLRAAQADPDLVKLLPPGASAAGAVDLAGMRGSNIYQTFSAMFQSKPAQHAEGGEASERDAMKAKAMSVFEKVDSMVIGSYIDNPDAPAEREDVFAIKGKLSQADVDELTKETPASKVEHRGVTIYNIPRDTPMHSEESFEGAAPAPMEPKPPVSLAILSDAIAVAGSESRVKQAIDRFLDGGAPANLDLLAKGGPISDTYQLWHIVDAAPIKAMAPPAGAAPAPGSEGGMAAGMMAGLLNDVDQVRIGLQVDEGLALRLEGLFASPEKAKLASQMFAGLLAIVKLGGQSAGPAADSPVPPQALALLKLVEPVSDEQSAGVALRVKGEEIGKLMLSLMAGAAAQADP